MDKKTVFVKTSSGESEVSGQTDALYGDAKRILHLVDDESTVAEITKRAPPSLRDSLQNVLQELADGGYIRDMRAPVNVPQKPTLKFTTPTLKMATPKAAEAAQAPVRPTPSAEPAVRPASNATKPSMSMPDMTMPVMPPSTSKKEEPPKSTSNGDLDFSFITSGASKSVVEPEVNKDKAKADAMAKARQEADAARLKAEQSAQIEATAKAAKLKAYEEAKEKAKIEVAVKARTQAEQEAIKARTELEATKARVESEVRARIEAEARVKKEVEAAKAKAEAEMRSRIEAEARAKAEVEARLKREAEAERLRIEKERAELELAKVKAEAEIKMRAEAELRVRAEVEARLKQEAEAERLRLEKERAELELARVKAEAEIKMRTEAELRVRAEVEARLQAEALAKQADRSNPSLSSLLNGVSAKEEQVDPAEKLRQSFVESFGQHKASQKAGPENFKLDTFSLPGAGIKADITPLPVKAEVPPGGGSKVKAAIEQRAKQEAEQKRLKAEQEAAQLRAEQEKAARIKAEQDSARLKAEQEAYRLKVAQDEERAKAEAEAQKLSNQQSKQWEEAQRRAANQAQIESERLAKQLAESKEKSSRKSTRSPRKPLPLGKIAASLFVLALIAVAGLPYVWPLDEYIAPLEQEISAQIKQPVHIKKLDFALLPLPKIELHNVSVGKVEELKVGNVVLNFDFSALFAPTKSINNLELSGIKLNESSFDKVLVWLQAAGGSEKYPVVKMELSGVQLISNEIKVPLLKGSADFDAQGKFTRANLKSEDDKFIIELQSLQNRLQLALNIHESNLPILTDFKFNDLSVSGVVDNGEIVLSDFFAHIYGGTLTGKGQLNWNNGWKLQGKLNAKSLELKNMFPNFGVTGELFGDVDISMNGLTPGQIDKDPHMDGSFEVKNGVIGKLDIDTVARMGSRKGVAGHTDFSEITGTLKADKHSQRIYLNKIIAGSISATGLLEVDENQQLSGKLLVDIKGLAKGIVPLQISGSLLEPLLQQGR